MASARRALASALAVWAIPFAVAFLVFPLHDAERALFESIMAVAVAATTAVLSARHLARISTDFIREGALLGSVFLAVSLALDLLVFSRGPMAMAPLEYVKDIGVTYLMMPVITTGIGYVAERSSGKRAPDRRRN